MTKFYMAEAILAVESVHKLNFIHRDLKPDNILVDRIGHLKLTDFGLCKPFKVGTNVPGDEFDQQGSRKTNSTDKRERVYSMVGTIDYIAPEVFTKDGYTETVDWWSLGTIMFEMLMGYPPFTGKDPAVTCKQVMNYERYFEIPEDYGISPEAIDLLKRLISRPET
jgi:serine/threonine kinase 38